MTPPPSSAEKKTGRNIVPSRASVVYMLMAFGGLLVTILLAAHVF